MWDVMFWPIVACVLLPWLLVYLGLHVVKRGIIFIDIAMAQMASLGICVAVLLHLDVDGWPAFGIALGFAGALRAEIASPTVADEPELERLTGARVIATVGPTQNDGEVERRKGNRIAPQYINPADGAYQLATTPESTDPRVHWIGVGRGGQNVAITSLAVRKNYYGSFDYQAFASLVNYSREPPTFDFKLEVEGRTIAEKSISGSAIQSRRGAVVRQ